LINAKSRIYFLYEEIMKYEEKINTLVQEKQEEPGSFDQ
jgi:hypothetical protein